MGYLWSFKWKISEDTFSRTVFSLSWLKWTQLDFSTAEGWRPQEFYQKHNSTDAGGRQSSLSNAPGQERLHSSYCAASQEAKYFWGLPRASHANNYFQHFLPPFSSWGSSIPAVFFALFSKGTANVLSRVESFMVLLDPSSNLWHSASTLWPKRSTAANFL